MRRGARSLRPLDVTRLGLAASRPGIDPRTWVCLGRVIEVTYDQGQLVVVEVIEGALLGEPVTCEVTGALASQGGTSQQAIAQGDLCVVALPAGDANNMGLVLGFFHEPETPPPATVNGQAIDAALLTHSHVLADPARGLELELGSVRLAAAGGIRLGPDPNPTQPFVRGQALAAALGTFCDQSTEYCTTLLAALSAGQGAATGPLAPLGPFFSGAIESVTAWQAAISALSAHLVEGDVLSAHITGE